MNKSYRHYLQRMHEKRLCIQLTECDWTLTHGFQLANEFLLCPFGPFFLVCIDGAQDGPTRLPTILDSWHIQVVDQHNVWVLGKRQE